MNLSKQNAIDSLLTPFLSLKGEIKWMDSYNAITQFIQILNELEKAGKITFVDPKPVEESKS